jgi:hypothetical protein
MAAIARVLDRLLSWLKWPIAVVSLIALPGLLYALYFVLRSIVRAPAPLYPFLGGAAVFTALWYLLLRGRSSLGFLATFEHELTHALFALATFHRVVGFRASMRGGGHIRYLGRGNWLIAVAPYFFPTVSLAVIIVLSYLPGRNVQLGAFVLGATVAYHGFSTWSETHRHQSDLREAGWLFCLLFLSAANALVFGLLLSYAGGLRSVTAHLARVRGPSVAFFEWIVKLLLS